MGPIDAPEEYVFRHHPILGTVVEIRIDAPEERTARTAEHAIVSEMIRLERVFSAYDPDSELQRWKRGELDRPSAEFVAVLDAAAAWQASSGGAFNPMSGLLTARWRRAEQSGQVPDPGELDELAASIAAPRFAVVDGVPERLGDCADLQLNAFAKGWIVDRALGVARSIGGLERVTVNAGGDLAHFGDRAIRVGIENPHRPYDNEPPVAFVDLRGAGLATSGRARRGFRIGDRWFSHVVDPRTGRSVDHISSVTVVAVDAATADVVATIVGVEPVAVAIRRADELGVACLLIDRNAHQVASERWHEFVAS